MTIDFKPKSAIEKQLDRLDRGGSLSPS